MKNLLFSLALSVSLFIPILGMENQQEAAQIRHQSAQLLDYISRAMTDVELYDESPLGIQEIILYLEGRDKKQLNL